MKIGDKVRVKYNGKTHNTYHSLFKKLNFKNENINADWKNGEEGVVFGVTAHESASNIKLVAIRHKDGRECLINVEGVELITTLSKYESITREIKELEKKLASLYKEQASLPTTIPMYRKIKGKDTVVLQPITQQRNLELNGWKTVDKEFINNLIK